MKMVLQTVTVIKDIVLNLLFIFRPDYWLMNNRFNKEWDDELKSLLDNYSFRNTGGHYADLGDTKIWVSNHPYASFTKDGNDKRPSRLTIWRAKKILNKQIAFNKFVGESDIINDYPNGPNYIFPTYRRPLHNEDPTSSSCAGSITIEFKNAFRKK